VLSGFIEGENRQQATLFPERLDDYVHEESPVRVIDMFIDELDITGLGFRTERSETGWSSYHPRLAQLASWSGLWLSPSHLEEAYRKTRSLFTRGVVSYFVSGRRRTLCT